MTDQEKHDAMKKRMDELFRSTFFRRPVQEVTEREAEHHGVSLPQTTSAHHPRSAPAGAPGASRRRPTTDASCVARIAVAPNCSTVSRNRSRIRPAFIGSDRGRRLVSHGDGGRCAKARAMATRWRSPTDRAAGRLARCRVKPRRSASAVTVPSSPRPRTRRDSAMLSRTLRYGSSPPVCRT